jgi:hypothetical protein
MHMVVYIDIDDHQIPQLLRMMRGRIRVLPAAGSFPHVVLVVMHASFRLVHDCVWG